MASAWGLSWGSSWGNSWGATAVVTIDAGSDLHDGVLYVDFSRREKNRREREARDDAWHADRRRALDDAWNEAFGLNQTAALEAIEPKPDSSPAIMQAILAAYQREEARKAIEAQQMEDDTMMVLLLA